MIKLKIVFLSALFFITNLTAQNMNQIENYNQIISEIKNEFAPDKRTAIFDVEVSKDGNKIKLAGETNIPSAKEKLLSKIDDKNLIDEVKVLPDEKLGDKIYGVVKLSVANIRTNPENSAEMATQALLGTPLKIYKRSRGWFLVQTPDKYIGWMDFDGSELMNEAEFNEWENSPKVIVTAAYGFSFSGTDKDATPVSDIVEGDIIKFLSIDGSFVKVEYPDKRTAYISSDKVENYSNWLNERKTNSENIITTAKNFMGIPYMWGGTSTKAFDCSGFTKTVYFLNGVMLPRDASQQVHTGELVDTKDGFNNLKPGDLLFFGRKATDSTAERITHVALYIGDTEFIHASGRVRINSLDKSRPNYSEYRFNQFVRAKRILASLDKNGIENLKSIKYYSK